MLSIQAYTEHLKSIYEHLKRLNLTNVLKVY